MGFICFSFLLQPLQSDVHCARMGIKSIFFTHIERQWDFNNATECVLYQLKVEWVGR